MSPTATIVVPVWRVTAGTVALLRSLSRVLVAERLDLVIAGTRETCETLSAEVGSSAARLAEAEATTYAACANAGARAARGELLIFLEALPLRDDWPVLVAAAFADPDVGAVGGRLAGAPGSSSGGLILVPPGAQRPGFALLPTAGSIDERSAADGLADCDLLLRACFATRSDLFARLGGFDEAFADGDEVFDLCLRARDLDLRIVEASALVIRVEGTAWPRPDDRDEKRRAFLERWFTRARPRPNLRCERRGVVLRADGSGTAGRIAVPLPPTTVVVHGAQSADRGKFEAAIARSRLRPERVIWAGDAGGDDARTATESRGEGYVAFVRTDTVLHADWLNVLVDELEFADDVVAATAAEGNPDGRCTLVAPHLVPQHLRIDPLLTVDAGVADWLGRAAALGRSVRCAAGVADVGPRAPEPHAATTVAEPPFASIVMLSWNGPEYTESAVASIARCTHLPHEIIVVDNGSTEDTRARLARLENVRIIYNERNLGFATGCNQGAAVARGTHVVWLNNDVIVTEGWLEALVALHGRRATIGISAPVSNNVHGHQRIADAPADPALLPAFAAGRAARLHGRWYRADVVMGLCLCIRREVIDEIGGMDPRYAIGNFEDVDYCVRTRAAGYEIAVCEDAFIYHFGSVSFRANGVDYDGLSNANFTRFVERWKVRPELPLTTAVLDPIRRGFSRPTDFVPLPKG